MRFTPEFLDELKYRCDIEQLIGTYVTLKRAGSNYLGLCPFHNERTPSFTVFPATRNFHCFGCGVGGDVITFVMKAENLDYPQAVVKLAERVGLPIPAMTDAEKSIAEKRTRIYAMNREAARFFHEILYSPAGRDGLAYLQGRGLSDGVIKHFGLGYAPNEFGMLTDVLRKKGYRDEEMTEAFLCGISKKNGRPYDYFRGRVMYPIFDTSGNVIAFGGRVLDDSKPKYLNTSDTPAFKKSRNLFALNFARTKCAEEMILCEGYMDVIALHEAGFEQAVATLGTSITPEHARIMAKYTKRVQIAYDMDGAGRTAADRAIGLLTGVGLDVRVLKMEGAKDPDEYIRKFGVSRFRTLLDGSAGQLDYRVEAILSKYDLTLFEDKIKAAKEVAVLLGTVYSDVERDAYILRVAAKLEITPESLRGDVKREIRRRQSKEKKEETRKIHTDLSGITDRVNPERAKYHRANGAEETILGILMLYPELFPKVASSYENGIQLCEEDFITEFGRLAYGTMARVYRENGRLDIAYLTEEMTEEQLRRLNQLTVRRQLLTCNDEGIVGESVAVLRSESEKNNVKRQDDIDLDDLTRLLAKKRGENQQ